MTLFIALISVVVLLIAVALLVSLIRTRRHLTRRTDALTPYTDAHGLDLEARAGRVQRTSAAHRAALDQEFETLDGEYPDDQRRDAYERLTRLRAEIRIAKEKGQ